MSRYYVVETLRTRSCRTSGGEDFSLPSKQGAAPWRNCIWRFPENGLLRTSWSQGNYESHVCVEDETWTAISKFWVADFQKYLAWKSSSQSIFRVSTSLKLSFRNPRGGSSQHVVCVAASSIFGPQAAWLCSDIAYSSILLAMSLSLSARNPSDGSSQNFWFVLSHWAVSDYRTHVATFHVGNFNCIETALSLSARNPRGGSSQHFVYAGHIWLADCTRFMWWYSRPMWNAILMHVECAR